MKRILRFISLVWDGVGLNFYEFVGVLTASILLTTFVLIPISALAWFLSWITHQHFGDAFSPAVGILLLVVGIIYALDYLSELWKKSGKE